MSILGQWTRVYSLCIRKRFKADVDTQNVYYLTPIIFVVAITDQVKASGGKHISHIKLLELCTHVIYIVINQEEENET